MSNAQEHADAAIAMLAETSTYLGLQLRGAIIQVVSFAMMEERERCARIAEAMAIPGHSVQAPSCVEIAKAIREGRTS